MPTRPTSVPGASDLMMDGTDLIDTAMGA